jgi:Tol biopolymer transport system component
MSVASSGTQANIVSSHALISADGRHGAFTSAASNLVPGDTNGIADAFVRDLDTGITQRISVASDGTQANGPSSAEAISADGRFVAFSGDASNLVAGDSNQKTDVFVRDRQTGVTERVSVASDGTEANADCWAESISADGRFVTLASDASNLVSGDTNNNTDVFVHDRQTGLTERISVASDGMEGNDGSFDSRISADGRFVAFASFCSNLVLNDTNETGDVFVHDRATGATEMVSVPSDGDTAKDQTTYFGGPYSSQPRISADGRFVAFVSQATNLVPGDLNGAADVFVRDRQKGLTERVSVASDGTEANGWELGSISADGRYVAFTSSGSQPAAGGSGVDVFVHDRATGATELIPVASNGALPNEATRHASISADGRRVAFESYASNLVPGDTNGAADVFFRDRGPEVGVGLVSTFSEDNSITVTGWSTFSGQVLASAMDPPDDGLPGAGPSGAELTSASLTYRPESENLFVRLHLLPIPPNQRECIGPVFCENTGAGAPGVLYGFGFNREPFRYEVRILRSATASPPSAPVVALYRCLPVCEGCTAVCEKISGASGAIGTTGDEVVASISLRELGSPQCCYTPITAMRAFTATGGAESGTAAIITSDDISIIDQIDFPDATLYPTLVSLGIAPRGTPANQVLFDRETTFSQGNFWGSVDASALSAVPYDVWARACVGPVCGPAVPWLPIQLLGAVSRKLHGNAGSFDVDLAQNGNPGIECRTGGANGDHTMIYTFANNLTSIGWASVTSGAGSVTNSGIGSDPHQYVVNLTGVTNAQSILVTLSNVRDSTGNSSTAVSAQMSLLIGDTNGDGVVNSADIAQTKSQSGSVLGAFNFRGDVTIDGALNSSDIALVKSKSGTALP